MPFLTSLLLFLSGLAILIALVRQRPKARLRRLEDWEENKMELGARICEAAARDAFGVHLDHSDASLADLDRMVAQGWPRTQFEEADVIVQPAEEVQDAPAGENDWAAAQLAAQGVLPAPDTAQAATTNKSASESTHDALFVLASYLGNIFVEHHEAEWRLDPKTHHWPFIFFEVSDLAASPFDIMIRKFADPEGFSLQEAARRLLEEVERRKHTRATTWHTAGHEAVSFRPSSSPDDTPHREAAITHSVPKTQIEPAPGRTITEAMNGEAERNESATGEAATGAPATGESTH